MTFVVSRFVDQDLSSDESDTDNSESSDDSEGVDALGDCDRESSISSSDTEVLSNTDSGSESDAEHLNERASENRNDSWVLRFPRVLFDAVFALVEKCRSRGREL